MTIATHYGLYHNDDIPHLSKDFYCGCEFEIESCKKIPDSLKKRLIVDVDHSLRNNGHEFKTYPCTFEQALEHFKFLHETLVVGDEPFSERTSIHVHVNVAQFELEQLRQMVLTYALLEPLFFNFVGELRKESIFCVPLNYTYMPSIYKASLDKMVEKWHKYTAFNLLPIKAQPDAPGLGTVEFRHLYGTGDITVFKSWLTAIKQLYTWFVDNPTWNVLEKIEAGMSPHTIAFLIVPELTKGLGVSTVNEMCADTTLDVKLSVGGLSDGVKKPATPRTRKEPKLGELVAMQQQMQAAMAQQATPIPAASWVTSDFEVQA